MRVVVIGGGSIGERHVRCFQQTRRVDVALCEIDAALRERVAQAYRLRETFGDVDEAVERGFQAAVICTPAHLHVALARKFVAAGTHVLIEKPLSVSLEGVAELAAAASEANLVAAVAYVYRAHPALAAMREAIQSGRFGRPLHATVVAGQNFPHYRPAYRQSYYTDHATGGGAVQDALTHLVDAVQWLVGPIDRLAADAAHQKLEGVTVEDTVGVIARHGDVPAVYSLNQFQPPNETTITVACEHGAARFEYHRRRWRWMTHPESPWQDEPCEPLERDTLFQMQAARFLDAIEHGAPPLCSLAEGWLALRANLAILRSVQSNSWQSTEPLS
ncbi:MAG: Gfo/Idh/MocA family oxidoreductase [Pirellulaceae bacterium]